MSSNRDLISHEETVLVDLQAMAHAAPVDLPEADGSSAPTAAPWPIEKPKRRRTKGKSPWWLKLLVVFGAILTLVASCVIGGFYALTARYEGKVTRDDILGGLPQPEDGGRWSTGPLNFLLLGSDSRETDATLQSDQDGDRSDTIMLLHVSRNLQSAFIVSIPRDSYVDIPAHGDWKGGKNKINAAFAFGGAKLAAKTVFNLTNVPLDGAMIVYMSGVGEMIKELGGVKVCVEETARSNDGSKVWEKGCHDMKFDEALEFMRQRKQLRGGDFSRIHNQQLVIKALATKIFNKGMLKDPVELDKLVGLAAESITVDKNMDLRELVFALKGIKPANIKFATAPFTTASLKTDAGSAVQLDMKGTEELCQAVINDQTDAWLADHPQKVPTL